MRDLFEIIELENTQALLDFQKFCFGLLSCSSHEDFSKTLIKKHTGDANFTGFLQDQIMNSIEFFELTQNDIFRNLAAIQMGVPKEDIKIVFPHFRIDLPSMFANDGSKMSLPWHQEAGYYLHKGDCTLNSVVMSTYLHDCNRSNGAVEIATDFESELLHHDGKYMLPEERKFYRVECPAPKNFAVAETKFGEIISFDFRRPHRSGSNTSALARLTFLLRATSISELKSFELGGAQT